MAEKVTYIFDKLKVFNRAIKESPRVKDALRGSLFSADVNRQLGLRLIDEIVNRTQGGIDKNGKAFVKYSQSYKDSLEFKAYGKGNEVNLTLTEDMLTGMVPKTQGKLITIEFQDKKNNDKAHGHINGTVSKRGKRQLPVRDFFGLPEEAEDEIMLSIVEDNARSAFQAAIESATFDNEIDLTVGRQQTNIRTVGSDFEDEL